MTNGGSVQVQFLAFRFASGRVGYHPLVDADRRSDNLKTVMFSFDRLKCTVPQNDGSCLVVWGEEDVYGR